MTKFIKFVIIFITPLVLLAYPLDLALSAQFKKAFVAEGEIVVWDDIYSGNISDSCYIIGSSRAWVQFDPKSFTNKANIGTYNFGIDGHNFFLQKARYDETVKYNKAPKYVILSVESTTLQKRPDLYNKEQFLPFMLWNKDIESFTKDYAGFDEYDFNIPLVRYAGHSAPLTKVFLNLLKPTTQKREKGYLARDEKWNDDFEKAKLLGKQAIKIDSISVELFDKFISDCKDNGIKTAIVYAPEYIEGQSLISNRDSIINIYKRISSKHGLFFYDYSSSEISNNKQYFYNSQHLNKTGSLIFSDDITETLRKTNFFN